MGNLSIITGLFSNKAELFSIIKGNISNINEYFPAIWNKLQASWEYFPSLWDTLQIRRKLSNSKELLFKSKEIPSVIIEILS